MTRPTFAETIAALRTTDARFPWVKPTPEEDDVAAVLTDVESAHQGDADEPDARGNWGRCLVCGVWWPCPIWVDTQNLAIQFLGRAADRVMTRVRATFDEQSTQVADVPHPRHESPESEPA